MSVTAAGYKHLSVHSLQTDREALKEEAHHAGVVETLVRSMESGKLTQVRSCLVRPGPESGHRHRHEVHIWRQGGWGGKGIVLGVLSVAGPREGIERVSDSGIDEIWAERGSYCYVEGGRRLAVAELPPLEEDVARPTVGVVIAQPTGLLLRR